MRTLVTLGFLIALAAAFTHSFQPGFFVPRSVSQKQQGTSPAFADNANIDAFVDPSCLYHGSSVASDEKIHPARGCGFCIG
mmetsp:Transcript_3565/g.7540  ORF Transcript_3565/g.7540 Transcript_3565/m.7540 type:complete len:81 (+) Transcript_3565:126-368(+)